MNQPAPRRDSGLREKILPVIIAISAAGVGVTGTLLWVQSSSSPIAKQSPAMADRGSSSIIPAVKPMMPPNGATTPNGETIPNGGAAPESGATTGSSNAGGTPEVHEPPAALTMNLTPPQAALRQGNWYYDHEQWQRAIAEYEKAIAAGLDNPNIRTDLGNCYRFNDQPQKALQQYRTAQKQDPQHEQSLFNQGALFASSLNDRTKGIAIWRQYLKRFPKGQSVEQAKKLIAAASSKQ